MSTNDNSGENGDSVVDTEVMSRLDTLSVNNSIKKSLHYVFSAMFFIFIFYIWYIGDNVEQMNKASFILLAMHLSILAVIDYQLSKLKEETEISIIPPTKEGFEYLGKNIINTLKSWGPLIILFIALYVFPGWLIPFSNTFGYAFSYKISGDVFSDVLKQPEGLSKENKMGRMMLRKFEYDGYKNLFMNLLSKDKSSEGIKTTLEKINKDMGIFNDELFNNSDDGKPSPYLTKIQTMIRLKDVISRVIWIALTIILCNLMHNMYSNDFIYTA